MRRSTHEFNTLTDSDSFFVPKKLILFLQLINEISQIN